MSSSQETHHQHMSSLVRPVVLATLFMGNLNVQSPNIHFVFDEKLAKLSGACEQTLRDHVATVSGIVRRKYIEEGLAQADGAVIDISVSFDVTWHKGGHTSHT